MSPRPTSPARAAASRRNGRRSAGPRTSDGKRRSAANGFRHGLRSDRPFLPGDSRPLYDGLTAALLPLFDPRTPEEHHFARRLADAVWMWLRCFLANFGLGFVLAADLEAALASTLAAPVAAMPSAAAVDRYASRVVRRFTVDLDRYTRLKTSASGYFVQPYSDFACTSRDAGVDDLSGSLVPRPPATSASQRSNFKSAIPSSPCAPCPRVENPGPPIPASGSLVQPSFPLQAFLFGRPDDAENILKMLSWQWAFDVYALAPDLFGEPLRRQLIEALPAFEELLPGDVFDELARIVYPPRASTDASGSLVPRTGATALSEISNLKSGIPPASSSPCAPCLRVENPVFPDPDSGSVVQPSHHP